MDPINLKRLKIEEYDSFFDSFEASINGIVDMSNDTNDSISEIKDAAATVLGAIKLTVLADAKSTDTVLIDATAADGKSRPEAAAVKKLLETATVAAADKALAAAADGLAEALTGSSSHVALSVAEDGACLVEPAEGGAVAEKVKAVNAAIKALQAAAGSEIKVKATVVPTKAFGAQTFGFKLRKAVFVNFADEPTMHTATPLEIASSRQANVIATMAVATAYQAAAIASAAAALTEARLAVKGRRLIVAAAAAGDDGQEAVASYKSLVQTANVALYKLWKGTLGLDEDVNVVKAFKVMVLNLVDFIKARGGPAVSGKELRDLVSLEPSVQTTEDGGIEFDWGIKTKLEEFAWPGCLPGPAKLVYESINAALERAKVTVAAVPTTTDEVKGLIEKSKTTFENPKEKIDAAGLDMMAAAKATAALTRNVNTITGSPAIVQTLVATVARLADELKKAACELKDMAAPPATAAA